MAKKIIETRRMDTDPHTHRIRKTQIEFKVKCEYCHSEYWAKSRKSQFCSNNCRWLNHRDQSIAAEVKRSADFKKSIEAEKKKEREKEKLFHKKRPQTKPKLNVKPKKK